MKSWLRLAVLFTGLGISVARSQGVVGSIVYHTARGAGKVVPIYGIDPLDPTYRVQGDNRALYARREPLYGANYWAELWAGPRRATESGLSPVPGSRVHFRDDVSAIQGIRNLHIPGTLGGDEMTFQLRVWAAESSSGQLVSSWDEVLSHDEVPRGLSPVTQMTLGNVSADGHLYLPQNLAFNLQGFGLFIVPEPYSALILSLGASGLWAARRRPLYRRSPQPRGGDALVVFSPTPNPPSL